MRKLLVFISILAFAIPTLAQHTIKVKELKDGTFRTHQVVKNNEVLTWKAHNKENFYVIFVDSDFCGNLPLHVTPDNPGQCTVTVADKNVHEYCLQDASDGSSPGTCTPSSASRTRSSAPRRRHTGKGLTMHCDGCFFVLDGSNAADQVAKHPEHR